MEKHTKEKLIELVIYIISECLQYAETQKETKI